MAMGSQQLAEDYTQLKELLELYPNISILKAEGQPPDNYEIEYNLRGFLKDADNNISIGKNHLVRISLPFGYPHFAPIAKPLTPFSTRISTPPPSASRTAGNKILRCLNWCCTSAR